MNPVGASGSVPHARLAVSLLFFANGMAFATWAAELPVVKARLGLSDGAFSIPLFAFAAGAFAAMAFAGYVTARLRATPTIRAAGFVYAGLLAAVPAAPGELSLVVGAAAMGIAQGVLDVTMNVQATTLDGASRAPILSSIHAFFYVGGLVGAAMVAVLFAFDYDGRIVGTGLSALVALAIGVASASPLAGGGEIGARRVVLLPRRAVLRIGAFVLLAFYVEGAIMDWGTIYVASLDDARSLPALSFAVFAGAMVAGRLTGDRFTARFGPKAVLRVSGLLTASGLMLAVLMPAPIAVLVGFGIVGLGLANVVPGLFAAAARIPKSPAPSSVAMVAMMGYSGALGGPPLVGLVAATMGLPSALALVSIGAVLIALAGPRSVSAKREETVSLGPAARRPATRRPLVPAPFTDNPSLSEPRDLHQCRHLADFDGTRHRPIVLEPASNDSAVGNLHQFDDVLWCESAADFAQACGGEAYVLPAPISSTVRERELMLLAAGTGKRDALRAILRSGLVSRLLVDGDLA